MSLATSSSPFRGKLPYSIVFISLCTFAFLALLYADSSWAFFKLKSCSRKIGVRKSKHRHSDHDELKNSAVDDRFEFDPEECSVNTGKWVFNKTIKPLYTDRSCPYLDRQVSCVKNGRKDSDYRHWEWQPEDCSLPRFDAEVALKKIRGKRLMFVGDSLQRGQWQSFVCLVEWIIPQDKKSLKRGDFHTVFTAKEYDATIEFYWAPYLVESNTDRPIIGDPKKRIIKVDSVAKHAKNWFGVDILVFNTYVWWMSGLTLKTLWGSFENGAEGYEVLDTAVAYKVGLRTWANWVDSNIDPNKTRVFFTTMSPTHSRSADWGKPNGTKCFNETRPITKRRFWSTGSDRKLMSAVNGVRDRMKVPVTFLNITQLSDYRIDGHASVYTETGGKLLTKEQRADPIHNADCIHWCLPGVPDTWNQIFLAYL
ncbi:Protein trichome birefringence-like 3 [Linum perenne]